jgi:hypothetical protein
MIRLACTVSNVPKEVSLEVLFPYRFRYDGKGPAHSECLQKVLQGLMHFLSVIIGRRWQNQQPGLWIASEAEKCRIARLTGSASKCCNVSYFQYSLRLRKSFAQHVTLLKRSSLPFMKGKDVTINRLISLFIITGIVPIQSSPMESVHTYDFIVSYYIERKWTFCGPRTICVQLENSIERQFVS